MFKLYRPTTSLLLNLHPTIKTFRNISRMSYPSQSPINPSAATSKDQKAWRPNRPRRFQSLDSKLANADKWDTTPKLRGIIFDVDGTLCLPQNYMFREMREALDIPKSVDILTHIRSLSNVPDDQISATTPSNPSNPSQPPSSELLSRDLSSSSPAPSSPQSRAVEKIRTIERRAMTSQRPQPGLSELMKYLTNNKVPKALCTRNFPAPVHHLLETYLPDEKFEPIVTRDTEGVLPKPSPEGLWMIARSWGLGLADDVQEDKTRSDIEVDMPESQEDPLEVARRVLGSGVIMVGDSIDDMAAGYRAGAATVLLANEENEHLVEHEYTDLSVRRLDELIEALQKGFVGREESQFSRATWPADIS